jgi:hypothetical protein
MDAEEVAATRVISSIPLRARLSDMDMEGMSQLAGMKGLLSERSVVAVLFELALREETGLLVLHRSGIVKEIFLANGDPQYVASNRPEELFGQYLLRRGLISDGELSMALVMLPHFDGKLGNALVALKLFRPVEVLRHLTLQAREKLLEAFTWEGGGYIFYQEHKYKQECAPVGLNAFELIGAGVQELPEEIVMRRLQRHLDLRLRPVSPLPVPPEVFRIGGGPRELYDSLGRGVTGRDLLDRIDDRQQRMARARLLHLLLETGIAVSG